MRNFKDIAIEEGRDAGKIFRVTEMAASQAEKWAARVLLAMAKSNVQIPKEAARQGIMGLASVGMSAFSGITWELAEPLLDEMFRCVTCILPEAPQGRPIIESDIEEISTRFKLRMVWAEVQFGFFAGDSPLISGLSPAPPVNPSNT